jgi:hypothetical protein
MPRYLSATDRRCESPRLWEMKALSYELEGVNLAGLCTLPTLNLNYGKSIPVSYSMRRFWETDLSRPRGMLFQDGSRRDRLKDDCYRFPVLHCFSIQPSSMA